MNDKAATENELLESFAAEAKRRCDVIAAGLATGSSDFETMRAEAHALNGTAAVVGLRRLAELAGLMESDLAEAKKSHQTSAALSPSSSALKRIGFSPQPAVVKLGCGANRR